MDSDEVIRTIIGNSPGIKTKHLLIEVQEKIHIGKSASFRRLNRLLRSKKIFRDKGHYYLEPPKGASRRAYENHIKEIISGLLVVAERGRYTMQGEIVPNPSFVEYALQHLKSGYSDIFNLDLTKSENMELFLERVNALIETLKLRDEPLKSKCDCCSGPL